ncbi:MAG TPA: TolC family protein [Prolixibacteraceae bacterium]|nr:TolC family protein [Prolixibacteraceae bacterium]
MNKVSILLGFIALLFLWGQRLHAQELYTLEKTLDVAYQNSPDIQTQQLSLEQSRERLNAQKAGLKSRFSLSVDPFSYEKKRSYEQLLSQWYNYKTISSSGTFSIVQPIKATDGKISLMNQFGYVNSTTNDKTPEEYYSNNVSLNISQPLFSKYNSNKMGLRQVELDLETALLRFAILKLTTEKSVSQYFYNVYQAQQSLDIAKEEQANQQKSYDIIKNKVDAGLSAEEELWQAELNLANAESSVNNAEVSLENAKDEMKQAIGMNLSADFNVLANVDVKTIDVKLEDAIAYALHQRMELRQYEISIETSKMNLLSTKDNDKIKGSVDLTVGLFGNDANVGQIYNTPTDNEKVALSFNIPIWDWGQRKSLIKVAEASLKTSEINYEHEKVTIEMEVRQIYRSLKNLVYQIDIAKKSVDNAQKTYELNLEKYENGDLTSMDLSLYQNQLSTQKNSLTSALINYKLELLELKIKTLWDFEAGKSVLPNIYSTNF